LKIGEGFCIDKFVVQAGKSGMGAIGMVWGHTEEAEVGVGT